MAIDYQLCPQCGSRGSIPILYGYPCNELLKQAEAGEAKLGGCEIWGGQPDYACKDCGYEWNRQQAIDSAYNKIKSLKASVGGYFGGCYTVVIDLDELFTTWNDLSSTTDSEFRKKIRKTTAQKVREHLKSLSLLDWKNKYRNPGITDGTQWSVDIITGKKLIHKYGDNNYPKQWDDFCRLVARTTGRKFS